MLDDIRNTHKRVSDRQREERDMYERGEINPLQYGLRTFGNAVDATIGNVADVGLDYVVPDALVEGLAQTAPVTAAKKLVQPVVTATEPLLTSLNNSVDLYPGAGRDAEALLSSASVFPLVSGVKKTRDAADRVNELTGKDSGKGMLLGSANNVISGYYGPDRAFSVASWLPTQVINTVKDIASPSSRAKYREAGITTSTQNIVKRALDRTVEAKTDAYNKITDALILASQKMPDEPLLGLVGVGVKNIKQKLDERAPEKKGIDRAVAQIQYTSRIHSQSGRKGNTELLDEIMRRSDLTDAVTYYPGAYADLIKTNRLKPYPLDGKGNVKKMPEYLPNEDLFTIEEHFGRAWTEPGKINPYKTVPFKEADSPILVIKNPGVGKAATGRHHMDVLVHAPFVKELESIFNGRSNISPDELYEKLNSVAQESKKLPDRKFHFSVPETGPFAKNKGRTKDGGVWITGSRAGSAITEGGINYLVKITPDGKMIGIMSDEHNLFEGMAGKVQKYSLNTVPALATVKAVIPNRLVAVTPPMIRDMVNYWKKEGKLDRTHKHPQGTKDDRTYKEVLEPIVDFEPSKEVLAAEQARQRGLFTAGGGLVLMGENAEE